MDMDFWSCVFFLVVSPIVLGPTSGLKAVDLARIRHDDMKLTCKLKCMNFIHVSKTDCKKEKKLTQNCSGDDSLVPHDFLHDLKLLQVVNQIRFVQFSIV